MAKARKKDKDSMKWKKKKWYQIIAPSTFNNQVLGETTTFEPGKVMGKALTVNLMNLTGEIRNQNINIGFKVTGIHDNRAQTEATAYTVSPSFIKRVVRRRHTRVDATFKLKTKDEKTVLVKPLLITRNNVNRSVVTALKSQALTELTKAVSGLAYQDFLKDIIRYKLQSELRKKLGKLYPLKSFEIKKMQLVEPEKRK